MSLKYEPRVEWYTESMSLKYEPASEPQIPNIKTHPVKTMLAACYLAILMVSDDNVSVLIREIASCKYDYA